MAQSLESALTDIPVLRTMLGLEQYDQGQRLAQGREVLQAMEALKELAAIQSLPARNRLHLANAAKEEYELEQFRERDRRVAEASQRRLTPTELQGPQPPGGGPLMSQPDFGGFVMDMLKHPSTSAYGAGIGKAVAGEFKNVPSGGRLYNPLTNEIVEGRTRSAIRDNLDVMRQALDDGDLELYESAKAYHEKLTTRGTGDRSRLMEEGLALVAKGSETGLSQKEMDRLQAIQGFLSARQVIQTPSGPQTIEGMEIPAITAFLSGAGKQGSGPGVPRPTLLTPGKPPPTPPGQKELSETEAKTMRQRADLTQRLEALVAGFDPGFTRNFPADPTGLAARIKLEAADRGYGDRAFANWWRGLYEPFAVKRHELFGATLTPKEDLNFNRLVSSLQSDPAQVLSLLTEMLNTSRQEYTSLMNEKLQHSDKKAVEAALRFGEANPYSFGKSAIEKADAAIKSQKAQKPTRTYKGRVEHEGKVHENVDIRVFPTHREYFINGWHRAD